MCVRKHVPETIYSLSVLAHALQRQEAEPFGMKRDGVFNHAVVSHGQSIAVAALLSAAKEKTTCRETWRNSNYCFGFENTISQTLNTNSNELK